MTTPDRKDRLAIFSLSVGHFINDAYSNFLGPLLPFLIPKLNLSIAEAGWLAAILVISSSFAQPLYGYISDRYLKAGLCRIQSAGHRSLHVLPGAGQ